VPSWTLLGQSALSGVFIGALYGLLGLGLTLCWGLLRQINLAHFALVFLGAYLTYQLSADGVDPLLTLAAIAPAFFVFGVLLHWLLARFKVSPLNTLLVTFGFMVMIESLIQWIWSADFRRLESHYAGIKWKVGALFVPLPELLTLAIAVGLAVDLGTKRARLFAMERRRSRERREAHLQRSRRGRHRRRHRADDDVVAVDHVHALVKQDLAHQILADQHALDAVLDCHRP